jgi:hypothetical protein
MPLVELTEGARRTMGVIRRNIAFSLVYNLAGAALAMGGWINPLIAAVLMPASSVTVVLASWWGRTFDASEAGRGATSAARAATAPTPGSRPAGVAAAEVTRA